MGRYLVGIVLDSQFGDRLGAFAQDKPVWLVDTPENRRAVAATAPRSDHTEPGAVTTFRVEANRSPAEWFMSVLPTVIEHHGEFSHDPAVSDLEVIGSTATPDLMAALTEYGFTSISPIANGFRASAA